MNEIVLRLAQRTAFILESVCQDQPEEVQTITVSHYFNKLGAENITIEVDSDVAGTIDELCAEINNTLNYYEKIYLLLLVQDCLLKMHHARGFNEHLYGIFECLGIDPALINKFRIFFEQDELLGIDKTEFLLLSPRESIDNEMLEGRWIEDNVPGGREYNKLAFSQIHGHLLVMFIDQIRAYVVRCIQGTDKTFELQSGQCNFRILRPGNELIIDGVPVLTFSDLKSRFLHLNEKRELTYSIDRIQYNNSKGITEIHTFSALENTGQLIGVIGREGVGKSVLLKLLAGKFKPTSGNISINGYDLWKNKYLLKGVIGFVPEEDLLFEDLSVSDNLSLTARLYYSNLSKKEIESKVNALLSRIDLIEMKHVIVGSVINKQIQPGQRRLINIALELLREPQILLVDNALSGLGMSDACKVIKVLHDYSFAGNLVITSISQVDSETFMLFDKIWILDEGGYPIYSGSVKVAPDYLFKHLKLTYQEKEDTDPARLLDWVNYRLPDKEAHVWKRVVEPQRWHDEFVRAQALQIQNPVIRSMLPARILKIPNLEVQLIIFSVRNFKCKFSKINEIVKTVLIGPLIALLVAFLLRTSASESYSLLHNENIPVYQFFSVIVSVFLGLIASVDEIIRERNILEKEEYQEFSRFSYLNSKILYLFPVIALQVLLYIITGNMILGIKEMFWIYWIVLFSSAAFGVLLGLIISSDFVSRHYIYKAVLPFIIAIQILLGGGLISFDRLNLGNHKFSPLGGDLMVSKWGYEALAVNQYMSNAFEKLVYQADRELDQAAFWAFQAIPELERSLITCLYSTNADSVSNSRELLQNELVKVAGIPDVADFEFLSRVSEIPENNEIAEEVSGYLNYLSYHFYDQVDTLTLRKTVLIGRLADSLGVGNFARLRQDYHNLAIEETVINSNEQKAYQITDNEIIRKSGIIFGTPQSDWGRAPLFSPVKNFNHESYETLWFNLAIIWMLTAICYVWVLFDLSGAIRNIFRIK